jgi:hypothetical protein
MDQISQTPGRIEFIDRLTVVHRISLAVMGLIPLYAAYDLLLRHSLPEGITPAHVVPLVISLGALLVSLLFIGAAFFGMDQRVVIEAATGAVIHTRRAAVLGSRTTRHPFAAIGGTDVAVHEWSEGPPTFNIKIDLLGGGSIEFGRFIVREDAERYLAEVRTLTGNK